MVAPGRRRAIALGASLAAHAALLALVVALEPRGRPARAPIPVQLIAGPRAAANSPPNSTATRTGTSTPAATGKPTATATGKPTATAAATSTPTTAAKPTGTTTPGSDAWLRAGGLEGGGEGSGGVGSPLAVPAPGRGGEKGGREPEHVVAKRVVDDLLADLRARERAVKTPDSYWSEMGSFLARGFEPGWEVLEGQARGGGLGIATRLREALAGYLDEAERFGRTGNPGGADLLAPGSRLATEEEQRRGARAAADALGTPVRSGPDGLFHRELKARVRIWQAADGRILKAKLSETSGNRLYDRAVLERLESLGEAAAVRLGPTPAQGRETEWAFATSFDMVPPVPVVGCNFDAYFVPGPCFYPLKTSSRSRVDLEAVR